MAAIELHGVTKRFDDIEAVSDLDLTVEEGEIFGFLGPNGAGKTTTIDMMLDFVRPTTGERSILGRPVERDPVHMRTRIGVLPEGGQPWERLTGRQHLEFAMTSKGVVGDPDVLLERVGILEDADRKAGGYSKGMAQRLLLAMALVGEPELLILDEPSTGLDPNGARDMREIVRQENERGATVFFSSHILQQVEAVCDRVGIMRHGRLVALDTIEGLRESVGDGGSFHLVVDQVAEDALQQIRALDGVTAVETNEESAPPAVVVQGDPSKTQILAILEEAGVEVQDFRTEEASLEDVFRAYTTERAEATT